MGYNIEISFNVLKLTSVTKIVDDVKELAEKHCCTYCYNDYDFDYKTQYQRSHGIIVLNFSHPNIHLLIDFLRSIRKSEGLYIEVIYDETTSSILYASQYYITQKMEKNLAKTFSKNKRERSYSDDDNMILDTFKRKSK